jgi:transposase
MIKHWKPLTLFLRVPGVPLDNNICEQALKMCVLHRKNSLFYKTAHGAWLGDLFMSFYHTSRLNGINAYHYLLSLAKNHTLLPQNPTRWFPWNYLDTLKNLGK